jgi:hypothetical protein
LCVPHELRPLRYQIRQQLGQGGRSVLYLAFDPTMDRLVALKLLTVNDAQWRERFLREARLVARLQHPNIITIHDVGSTDGQPFMAIAAACLPSASCCTSSSRTSRRSPATRRSWCCRRSSTAPRSGWFRSIRRSIRVLDDARDRATLDGVLAAALPGAHKQGTFTHRATAVGLACIDEDEPEGSYPVPVRAGSIVVMSSLAPHKTG